jgi:transcriptional regulator GlxA family with amidase domain
MLIDVSQTGKLPYRPLLTEIAHTDALVARAQGALDANKKKNITIQELAKAMSVNERSLSRRFAAAIRKSPLAYLQSSRLEAARGLLEAGNSSIQVIALEVSYSDASSFTRLFRKHFGLSPGSYRARFKPFREPTAKRGSLTAR